jgi:fructose-1,6-bisphosphatase/inositol monophosphatase family enzyme
MGEGLSKIDSHQFVGLANVTQEVVEEGMACLRDFQTGDQSFITESALDPGQFARIAAQTAEEAMREHSSERFPNLSIYSELSGQDEDDEDFNYTLLIGPLDGVRALSAGAPTSTVEASLVVGPNGRIAASTIGEAATGRLWVAHSGEVTRKIISTDSAKRNVSMTNTKVWDGSVREDGTVFIDNMRPFASHGRTILNAANIVALLDGVMREGVSVHNYGSNALHNALVANGGDKVQGLLQLLSADRGTLVARCML